MSWTKWNGDALIRQVTGACDLATEDATNAVKGQALQEVPHDSGFLSESIRVFDTPDDPLRKILSAGGGAGTGFPIVPYAFRWHEENANFQKGRKSKYIKDPLNQVGARALMNALLNRLREAL